MANIIYKGVKSLFRQNKLEFPDFSVFGERGDVIKFFCWQPNGKILFSEESGFRCVEEKHFVKARAFIKQAKNSHSDIVICPEYCMPWKILPEIINESEMQPDYGKIWCLGMEGIKCDVLENFMEKYNKNDNVTFLIEDLSDLHKNNFYSVIVYVVKTKQKNLVCIIQLKTTAATDQNGDLEARFLTKGNTIYYFADKTNGHCILSYICADALNQNIGQVKKKVNYSDCIILHPQMNPKPLHESFRYMRKTFLDFGGDKIRIISINWSKGTFLQIENNTQTDIKVEDSCSACYYNRKLPKEDIEELLVKNKGYGINLNYDHHISMWCMPETEHCLSFIIDSFDGNNINDVVKKHKEPLGKKYYKFNSSSNMWDEQNGCEVCNIDWQWIGSEFGFVQCNSPNCKLLELFKFFSVLLGKNLYDDLNMRDEKVAIIFNTDCDNEDVIKKKERIKAVKEAMINNLFPKKFSYLQNGNFRWILSEKGNLAPKDNENKILSVMYVDSANKALILKSIARFVQMMGEDAQANLIIYHWSDRGMSCYDEHYNININNPALVNSVDAIK